MRWVLTFVLIAQLHSSLRAQTDSVDNRPVGFIISQDAAAVWHDTGDILLAPLHFDDRAWLNTGAVVGGTLLLFPLDNPVRELSMRIQSSAGDVVSEVGREYGREIYGIALSGGLYIGGLTLRNSEVRSTGVMLFESMAFAGITTTVLKAITGRTRPYVGVGPYQFRGFQFENDRLSFPSGHSTVAFSVSSVLAARIKNTYAGIGLYSLAALTMFSRVYTDDHWLSDTFLGAAIGTAVGISVVNLHEHRDERSSIHVLPTLHGVRLTYNF